MQNNNMVMYSIGALFLLLCAVADSGYGQVVTLPDIDTSEFPNGIVSLPPGTPSVFTDVFSKYTKVLATNGKPIHFLIQDEWPEDEIIKVRNVMKHMLTDFPYSKYGRNKAAVANAMGDRKATMLLFNGPEAAREARQGPLGSTTDLQLQSMWTKETAVEGTEDYMNHITRDASYEEVLHLVQRSGIMNALPEFQAEIAAAHEAAAARGWSRDYNDGSNSVEYFAQEFDVYYDLWVVQPKRWEGRDLQPGEMPEGTAHWGQNAANTRARLLEIDPAAYELITSFFHPYLTYTPLLPMDFEGAFAIELDESQPYTYKAQHLRNVTLTGSKDASLTGNRHENILTGNSGNNVLKGGGGDDRLNGNSGNDTAVYAGTYADYSVTTHEGLVTVRDNRLNRDGTDSLTSIEFLQFSDQTIAGRLTRR